MSPAENLCLACGLCCDGTLFGHVKLGPRDDAKKLASQGLPIVRLRGKTAGAAFRQPCAALCTDRTCRVYADRPDQCRSFECGVFGAARAGRIDYEKAIKQVKQARRLADKAKALLQALGDQHEHCALSERFERMQQCLESGGADSAAMETFAELGTVVHRLNLLTHEKFYTQAEA